MIPFQTEFTLPGAGSWTFVIDRRRVHTSCSRIRSQDSVGGLLWLTPRRRFLYFCDWQEAHMLFVFCNALSCAGSWTFVIDRRRVYSLCFSNNFSYARSWTFVIYGWRVYSSWFLIRSEAPDPESFLIDRRRVCSSCFLIRFRAPVPWLLWLTEGMYALRVFWYALVGRFLDFCDWQEARMLFVFSNRLSSDGSRDLMICYRPNFRSFVKGRGVNQWRKAYLARPAGGSPKSNLSRDPGTKGGVGG